jgi:hypothetical protein
MRVGHVVAGALIIGLLGAFDNSHAQPLHEVSVDKLISFEKTVSEGLGRPVHCLLGYRSCLALLSLLDRKKIGGEQKTTLALVPPYRKAATPKDMTVLAAQEIDKLKDRADQSAATPYQTPSWALHQPADEEFYAKIWRDRELNLTLALGYIDHGSSNRFNYGVYATTLDRVKNFANEWNMTWTKIDDIESIAEVKITSDRLVRLRVIDPHIFCPDEQAIIDNIERSIKRDATGRILKFLDKAVFTRKGKCALQEERAGEAKRRFMQALAGANAEDMVLYHGHSRYGRGLDFGSFSGKSGKVAPTELTQATVESKSLAAVYLNGCSGGRNYADFVVKAKKSGKIVVWNTKAPSTIDSEDDLLLFVKGVFERRGLTAIERYLNLTQADGEWPSQVKIDR